MSPLLKLVFSSPERSQTIDIALLFQRLGLGLMMLSLHGWPKLSRYGEISSTFADPLGIGSPLSLTLAVGAEVGASILLILGLATRLAAVPLIVTMIVAAFVVHGNDVLGKGELALLYLGGYCVLLLAGAGRYSLDAIIYKKLS